MKITFISIIILFIGSYNTNAQDLEAGFGVGIGAPYIIENNDNKINIDYSLAFSSYADFKYLNTENYFGIKLRFQYMTANITGSDWKKTSNDMLNGKVSSLSTLVLLEHLNENNVWNFGYNFGFGYTRQNTIRDFFDDSSNTTNTYMSVNIAGIISRKVSKNLSVLLQPTLLWTDPVSSLSSKENWQIANEDVSGLLQLGMAYQFN